MKLHTGVVFDEYGRPVRSLTTDAGAQQGRPLAQLRKRHGTVVPAGRLVKVPESDVDRDRRLSREAARRRKEASAQ